MSIKFCKLLPLISAAPVRARMIALGFGLCLLAGCASATDPSDLTVSSIPISSQTPFVIPPGSYATAMERGMGAATDAQTAKTKGEWGMVRGQWEIAIDNLKRIPATDLNYAKGQQKLIEYRRNLAIAEQIEETAPY